MVEFETPPTVTFNTIHFNLKKPNPLPGPLSAEVIIYKEKDFPKNRLVTLI